MSRSLTIVMYHYVRHLQASRYPAIKGLEFEKFKDQLDYLQSKFTIVKMEDVIDAHRSPADLPENAALLTFDDGYIEHFNLVFPELHKRRLQGCFFPPVDPIRDRKLLDVNRLHFILASVSDHEKLAKDLDGELAAYQSDFDLQTKEDYRNQWAHANRFDVADTIYFKRMLQTALPERLRNIIAEKLFSKYVSSDERMFSEELYFSQDQARLMVENGMYFGSHGKSHYWLNQIPQNIQENEIETSLSFLKELGSPVDDFWVMCYPFGGWNEGLLDVLKNYDCDLGLTTVPDTADLTKHNPLTLPRFDTNDFPQ